MGAELSLFARRQDGTTIPVALSLGAFEQDGSSHLLATISDITTRKEREQESEERYERFRYVEEVAEVGYWELDLPGQDGPAPAASRPTAGSGPTEAASPSYWRI